MGSGRAGRHLSPHPSIHSGIVILSQCRIITEEVGGEVRLHRRLLVSPQGLLRRRVALAPRRGGQPCHRWSRLSLRWPASRATMIWRATSSPQRRWQRSRCRGNGRLLLEQLWNLPGGKQATELKEPEQTSVWQRIRGQEPLASAVRWDQQERRWPRHCRQGYQPQSGRCSQRPFAAKRCQGMLQ